MLGTELCDPCWELESKIRFNPVLARKILREHQPDVKYLTDLLEEFTKVQDRFDDAGAADGEVREALGYAIKESLIRGDISLPGSPDAWQLYDEEDLSKLACSALDKAASSLIDGILATPISRLDKLREWLSAEFMIQIG